MHTNTGDLIGAALDWAVIVALYGKHEASNPKHVRHFRDLRDGHPLHQQARYSERWDQGGPIIEREGIGFYDAGPKWWAGGRGQEWSREGPTPLVAAMRCYVASKLGDTVEVPEGL